MCQNLSRILRKKTKRIPTRLKSGGNSMDDPGRGSKLVHYFGGLGAVERSSGRHEEFIQRGCFLNAGMRPQHFVTRY